MSSTAPKFEACTVCHAIEDFEQLIDALDASIGENWGDLPFSHLSKFLSHSASDDLKFLLFAVGQSDDAEGVKSALTAAADAGIETIVVTRDLPQSTLNQLVRCGGDEYLDYPLAQGALEEVIASVSNESNPAELAQTQTPSPEVAPADLGQMEAEQIAQAALADTGTRNEEELAEVDDAQEPSIEEDISEDADFEAHQATDKDEPSTHEKPQLRLPKSDGTATILAVQGLSGGAGASTLAINLAAELATIGKDVSPSVCLLDFDFQFGATASALDLPQKAAVIETLSDTSVMDASSFAQALQQVGDKLFVFTAPEDLIPLDFVNSDDISLIIETARTQFDYVIIDMPHTITDWTQTVIEQSQLFLAVLENDLRSAQNCVRFRNALGAAGVSTSSLRFVLNRAPKFTDLNGKSRVKRMCESLDIALEFQMPDGGKPVTFAADQGEALHIAQPKNPLRKEIRKLASEIHKLSVTE